MCFISSLALSLSPSPSLSLCDFSCVNVRVSMSVATCACACVRAVFVCGVWTTGMQIDGLCILRSPLLVYLYGCSTCVLACHAHARSAYDLTSVRKSVCFGPHIHTPCMFAAGRCPLGVHLCAGIAGVRILGCVCVCKCV